MPNKRPSRSHSYTQEERVALASEIAQRFAAGEGPVRAIARSLGTTDTCFYNWRRAGLVQAAVAAATPAPVVSVRGRYATAEREALVAKVDELRAGGLSLGAACKAAGIAETSYRAWRPASRPLAMRAVEVQALVPVAAPTALALAPPRPTAVATMAGPLVLVAPGGYRVEGLAIEAAAALLRALA